VAAVDGDPARIGRDPDRLEPDVLDSGPPARRDEQAGRRAPPSLRDRLAEGRRLPRQQVVVALDDRDRGTQQPDRLGHLDPDGTAAEHQQPQWDLGQGRDLAVRPQTRQLAQARHGRERRIGARGDDDVLGGVRRPVDRDGAPTGQAAPPADDLDPRAAGPRHLLARGLDAARGVTRATAA
jgi:hypothetical protein